MSGRSRGPSRDSSGNSSLGGRTILLTRTRGDSAQLKQALEASGAAVECLPTTRREPTPAESLELAPLCEPERYTHVAFTSRTAVTLFVELIRTRVDSQRAGEVLAAWRLRHVAAVGPGTRDALENAGIPVHTVAPAEDVSRVGGAKALAAALLRETQLAAGDRVALPQSRIARSDLRSRLQAAGAVVDRIPLYDTVPEDARLAAGFVGDAAQGRFPDAIVFLSPSALMGFLKMTGKPGRNALTDGTLRAVSIGATTTQALKDHGIAVAAQAKRPEAEAITTAVLTALT